MLALTPAPDLTKTRTLLATLSEKAQQASVRRAAWTALIIGDENPGKTWTEAKSDEARQAFVSAIGNIMDPTLRAKCEPLLIGVLHEAKIPGGLRTAALRALPLAGPD